MASKTTGHRRAVEYTRCRGGVEVVAGRALKARDRVSAAGAVGQARLAYARGVFGVVTVERAFYDTEGRAAVPIVGVVIVTSLIGTDKGSIPTGWNTAGAARPHHVPTAAAVAQHHPQTFGAGQAQADAGAIHIAGLGGVVEDVGTLTGDAA